MKKRLPLNALLRHLKNVVLTVLALVLTLAAVQAAPVKSISGNVRDKAGDPITGVTVVVKSTTIGTTTDDNGNYAIKVPEANTVLVFSCVGYVTQEIHINNRSIINIRLVAQNNSLAEAVVVGYGTQKRANLTGSVASVDMKQIDNMPVGDLSSALRGSDWLPGVHINGGEARPGNPATLTIRNPPPGGKNGGSTGPLYVIDGVVRTEADFDLLDPSQIASISVVKDATAAIYGARAAQGVVLVQTKRGKEGKPQISYGSSYDVTSAVTVPTMMNGYQLATYLNDALIAQGKDSTNSAYYTPDELAYFKTHNYNWFNMAWKPAFTTRQTLNVSGGGRGATYFAGASYYYGNGYSDKIHYKRWTFQASSDINIANNLKLGLALNGAVSNDNTFFLKQGGENEEHDITNLLATPQFIPPYLDGLPVYLPGGSRSQGLNFFTVQALDNYTLSNTAEINVNANLQYNFPFLKGLKATIVYNKNYNNFWGKQYGTKYNVYQFTMGGDHNHIYEGTPTRSITLNNGDRVRINPAYTNAYQLNANLSYDRQFGKSHLNILALVEQAESYNETVSAESDGVVPVGMDYMNAALGAMTTTNSATESGTLSYAGRVNYNYAGKYIAEFDWRYDGSTKFAPHYRWGFFPSLSAAWVMSEENFLRNSSFINFLKLRGSAGHLGRDMTSDWSWLQSYSVLQGGHGAVFGGNGNLPITIKPGSMPNPYVTWDDINQYDVGLDGIVLNNHLTFNADAYFDHGYNLLTTLSSSVPFNVGSSPMPAQNYDISNSVGLEVTLGWKGTIGRDFHYFVTTGIGYENTKMIRTDVPVGQIGTWEDLTGKWTRNLGVQGYVYEGMFRSQDQVNDFLKQHPGYTIFGQTPEPGMLYYKDIRGPKDANGNYTAPDGIITTDDQTWIVPKIGFNKGVSFGLSWKGLSLHVKTSFSIGSQDFVPSSAMNEFSTKVSGPAFWVDHWTPQNPNAQYPNPYYQGDYNVTSAFWLVNSSYFDINLVDLSYSMSRSFCQRLGMSSCQFYAVVTNPLYIQNKILAYSLTYPILRTTSLGLNLGF